MIQSLRVAHRFIIPLVGIVVAGLLIAALARPRGPVIGSAPPLDQGKTPAVEPHHEGAPARLDSRTDSEDSVGPVSR